MRKQLHTTTEQTNLEKLRKGKNKTQDYMANLLGCTRKTYSNYEKGKQLPYINHLITLADYFGVSTDYVLGRSNCVGVDNEYINKKIGLNDKAIKGLEDMKAQVSAMYEIQESIYNKKGKIYHSFGLASDYIRLINYLLSNGSFKAFLGAFLNYSMSSYNIPTQYDNNNKCWGVLDRDYLHFASDINNLGDNIEMPLDNATIKAIAKNKMDIALFQLSSDYLKYDK